MKNGADLYHRSNRLAIRIGTVKCKSLREKQPEYRLGNWQSKPSPQEKETYKRDRKLRCGSSERTIHSFDSGGRLGDSTRL